MIVIMWEKQCHKPAMYWNGKFIAPKHIYADDWGMVQMALFYLQALDSMEWHFGMLNNAHMEVCHGVWLRDMGVGQHLLIPF